MQIRFIKDVTIVAIAAILLSGCVSKSDEKRAEKIITALPTEVAGCTFLGDVDTAGSTTIGVSRFYLKLRAADRNATHLVETHAYTVGLAGRIAGVALSGRAYRCPLGKGPILPNKDAEIKYDAPLIVPSLSSDIYD